MGTDDQTRTIQLNGCVIGVQGALGGREGIDRGMVAKERILEKKEISAKT